MKTELRIESKSYSLNFTKFYDLSIPINFNGSQPNTYGVEKASSKAYNDENFYGDTRKDGPCNFETYKITPHCNGTHTECIGHITKERISLNQCLKDAFFVSTLITVRPVTCQESYIPKLDSEDLVITKKMLEEKLKDVSNLFLEGLIVRTLPNTIDKMSADYMKTPPPFFTIEAMKYVRGLGVKHLLVDTPSVDRLFDDGILSCHNIFWNTEEKKLNQKTINYTISEMIYVDEKIIDGHYLLNLQIPSFVSDAAPSRPLIFKLDEI